MLAPTKTICMIVMNSITHDARVLKEAKSLSQAGYRVHVIGVSNESGSITDEQVQNNLTLHWINWRHLVHMHVRRAIDFGATITCILALGFSLYLGWSQIGLPSLFASQRVDHNVQYAFLIIFLALAISAFLWLRQKGCATHSGLISSAQNLYRSMSNVPVLRHGTEFFRLIVHKGARWYAKHLRNTLISAKIEALQPDVVHCHDLDTLPIGCSAKAKLCCRLVWDAHEIYEEVAQGNPSDRSKKRRMLQRLQEHVDGFITINDSIAQYYSDQYPLLPPALIIKNATRAAGAFYYDGRLHNAASIPTNQKILLYQGGYAEKRGLTNLVTSARYYNPDWTLVMMGWGNIEKTLREIATSVLADTQHKRTIPAVCFIPPAPQEDLHLWTAGGSAGIIPYENVGLNHLFCTPNKLWEYPNAGLPVICSNLVEMRKTIERHGFGWLLVDNATAGDIAQTINSLTEDELSLAQAACKRFISVDNWGVYEERLLDYYSSI